MGPTRILSGLARGCHPAPTVAVTAFSGAVARSAGAPVARVATTVLLGQLSVGWSNDAVDAARDRAARRREKPVVAGLVTRPEVAAMSVAAGVAALLAGRRLGPAACLVNATSLASAWAYNAGVKATPLSPAPYAVSFGLVPVVLTAVAADPPRPPSAALVTAAALVGVGAHFTNAVQDIATDRSQGTLGLPQRIGTRASGLASAALLSTAALVLRRARPGPPVPRLTAAGATLAALGGSATAAGRPRAGFRLTLAGAGALVCGLAASERPRP